MDNFLNRTFGVLRHTSDRKYSVYHAALDADGSQSVPVMHLPPDNWQAYFEGKWRKVYIQVSKTFIKYQGHDIEIQIEGVCQRGVGEP